MSINVTDVILQTSFVDTTTNMIPPTTAVATGREDLLKFAAYTVQGLFIFGCNMPTFLAVAKFTALNSENQYVMVAGLALADAMNGLAYICGGIYRSAIILLGTYHVKMTPWQCMGLPHNLLWVWTDTIAPLMLLVISIDRLLSVSMPLRYLSLSRNYALRFVGGAFAYTLLQGFVAIITSYNKADLAIHPGICYTFSATSATFYMYKGMTNVLFAFSSVIIYIIIINIGRTYYKNKLDQLLKSNNSTDLIKQNLRLQKKMTESLAISCLFTFVLYCIPYGCSNLLSQLPQVKLAFLAWSYVLSNLNAMINVVIYLTRHREMRMGVGALFMGKTMAPTLKLWLAHGNSNSTNNNTISVSAAKSQVAPDNRG